MRGKITKNVRERRHTHRFGPEEKIFERRERGECVIHDTTGPQDKTSQTSQDRTVLDRTRQNRTGQGRDRQNKIRKTRPDEARQGNRKQDKTR